MATLGTEESGHCREVQTRANVLDCKTVGFFLKISKEIGKAWRKSLTGV